MYISAFIPNHIHKYKGSLFSEHIWCLSYLQTIEQNHCPERTLPTKQMGKHALLLNEGIPRALRGKKLRLKNSLLLPLISEEINCC